jgi:serine/threonine-protein kinase RsbW
MNGLELRFAPTLDNASAATVAIREIAAAMLRTAGITGIDDNHAVLSKIELATGEACCNAVKHRAGNGEQDVITVSVVFQQHESRLTIVINDGNDTFDFSEALPDFEAHKESGYGIYIMRNTMDSVTYRREKGRNLIILEKIIEKGEKS